MSLSYASASAGSVYPMPALALVLHIIKKMGKHKDKFCFNCDRLINGSSWYSHLKSFPTHKEMQTDVAHQSNPEILPAKWEEGKREEDVDVDGAQLLDQNLSFHVFPAK